MTSKDKHQALITAFATKHGIDPLLLVRIAEGDALLQPLPALIMSKLTELAERGVDMHRIEVLGYGDDMYLTFDDIEISLTKQRR